MKSIWKFPIVIEDGRQSLIMPADAEILCVQMQHDVPNIWVKVETDLPKEKRTFVIYGTGHSINAYETLKYIGTVQMMNGMLVYHIFEVLDAAEEIQEAIPIPVM